MKTSTAPSHNQSGSLKGAKVIRCSFCRNKFSARPRDAVCPKCKRPANKPLALSLKLLSLILFPVGLIQSAQLRSSRPYAASQALLFSVVGALICAAIYFLVGRV